MLEIMKILTKIGNKSGVKRKFAKKTVLISSIVWWPHKSRVSIFYTRLQTSDGSVVSFQKTAVAVLVLLAVFLETAVAVIT